ncbi:GNAT family N-acetyltransferase [Candidatus Micrarchaeota archaeon]|nr:GNAT family N-acetyltransferase [Candidatus Micrarchaeota archaeon]MBU1930045.1 GNAT family N-acetyltransferase [Candidatus Micrarchaeota archaeon]
MAAVSSKKTTQSPPAKKLRGAMKRIPVTSSQDFPKVFTLAGGLVGFQYMPGKHPDSSFYIYLLPVGRRREAWKQFDVGEKGVAFQQLHPYSSGLKRPLLAKGTLTPWNPQKLKQAPPKLQRRAKNRTVLEVGFSIMPSHHAPKGKPSLLQKGIGTALLKELELQAKQKGVSLLAATVETHNEKSQRLLEKNGFVRVGGSVLKVQFGMAPHLHVYYYYKEL